jgi:hypothetical protein
MKFWTLPLIGLLAALPKPAHAAEDNQLWTSAGLRITTASDIKVDLIQHLRWDQNASEFLSAMPEFRVTFSPHEHSSVGVGYRLLHKRSGSGDFESAHRLQLQGEVEHELGRLTLGYRVKGQTRFKPKNQSFKTTLRNRLGVTVDTDSMLTPLATVESFSDTTSEGLEHRSIRGAVGGSIRLSKQHRLKLRYLHETSLGGSGDTDRILAVDYQFRHKVKTAD